MKIFTKSFSWFKIMKAYLEIFILLIESSRTFVKGFKITQFNSWWGNYIRYISTSSEGNDIRYASTSSEGQYTRYASTSSEGQNIWYSSTSSEGHDIRYASTSFEGHDRRVNTWFGSGSFIMTGQCFLSIWNDVLTDGQ